MQITTKQLRQIIQEELYNVLKEQENKQLNEVNLKQMIAALMMGAGVPSSAAADSITDMLDSAHGEQIQQVMDKDLSSKDYQVLLEPLDRLTTSLTDKTIAPEDKDDSSYKSVERDPKTGKTTPTALAGAGPAAKAFQVIQQLIPDGGQVEIIIDNSGMTPDWWDSEQIGLELQKNKNVKVSLESGDWYEQGNEVEVRKAKIDQGKTLVYVGAWPGSMGTGKALDLQIEFWNSDTGPERGKSLYKQGIK